MDYKVDVRYTLILDEEEYDLVLESLRCMTLPIDSGMTSKKWTERADALLKQMPNHVDDYD